MKEQKTFYRGDLPHYLPNDRPYFLTFRLAGSKPKDDLLLARLLLHRKFLEYDRVLDSLRSGPHYLRERAIAEIVSEAIHHRDGREYELHAYTIMSNHVHMVVTLPDDVKLPSVLQSLKRHTARACNSVLSRTGEFWLHEGYDHVIREGRFGHVVAYVLNNPVKAGIVRHWREHPHTYLADDLLGFD